MEAIAESTTTTAEVSGKACGMPWISPYLMVKDVAASLEFYEAAYGFARRFEKTGPDGTIMHAEMTWRDGLIMLGPEGACGGLTRSPATSGVASPVMLYVYSEDVNALFERAVAAGAQAEFPPTDMFWGDRLCKLGDLDGYSWNFATHKGAPADCQP